MNSDNNIWKRVRRSSFLVLSSEFSQRRTKNQEPRTGVSFCPAFSLIEVMLALMVVSVGLLSVLGLFPLGLDQSSRSAADSHAALFADEVMSGLRAYAETNWVHLDEAELPVAASNKFIDVGSTIITETNVYTNIYINTGGTIEDHALRFRLDLITNGNIKAVTLSVWSGQFGSTSAPNVFYEEFFRFSPQ